MVTEENNFISHFRFLFYTTHVRRSRAFPVHSENIYTHPYCSHRLVNLYCFFISLRKIGKIKPKTSIKRLE